MNQCKDCHYWGYEGSTPKWDVWPYDECRAVEEVRLDEKKNEGIRCDTFHNDDHGNEDIHTHALFGCILFKAKEPNHAAS